MHPTTNSTILRKRERITSVIANRETRGVELTIDDIAQHFGPDGYIEEGALDAHEAGRPAYWTVATYHQAAWLSFCDFANRYGLEQALALCVDPTWINKDRDTLLASLIPLNPAADCELRAHDEWEAAAPVAIAAE